MLILLKTGLILSFYSKDKEIHKNTQKEQNNGFLSTFLKISYRNVQNVIIILTIEAMEKIYFINLQTIRLRKGT